MMKKMARLFICAAIFTLLVCITGCNKSERELHTRKWSRISELNRRLLIDDFESFWFLDQPSQLSRWQVRENTGHVED